MPPSVTALHPPCVYCGEPADSAEHWLPRSFGRFRGYEVLRDRVCESCNKKLGLLDEELIRVGPEGVFREALGIAGRKSHRQVSPFHFRAASAHPVRVVEASSSHDVPELLWEVYREGGKPVGRPLRQVVVRTADGSRVAVPFPRGWTANTLKQALQSRGIASATLVEVYLDRDEVEGARPVLTEAFGKFEAQLYARDGHPETKRMRFENQIDTVYLRGIAKAGFHTAMRWLPISGAEREFESIKAFITSGQGNSDDYVHGGDEPFIHGLGSTWMPAVWGHFVATDVYPTEVVTRFQWFAGPTRRPLVWRVRIGSQPESVPEAGVGLFVRYFGEPTPDSDGEILRLRLVAGNQD